MSAEYQAQDPFSSPAFKALHEFVIESAVGFRSGQGELEEFERELHRRVSAFEADIVGRHLVRYDIDVPEVQVEGQLFRRKDKYKKPYCGLAGTSRSSGPSMFLDREGARRSARWNCAPASLKERGPHWPRDGWPVPLRSPHPRRQRRRSKSSGA
jgi:hypothetical protein